MVWVEGLRFCVLQTEIKGSGINKLTAVLPQLISDTQVFDLSVMMHTAALTIAASLLVLSLALYIPRSPGSAVEPYR